jgi:hypothetical protein
VRLENGRCRIIDARDSDSVLLVPPQES